MAAIAARSVLTVVLIVARVASEAILRCSFEDAVDMAACAGRIHVSAGQPERRCVVIEDRPLPSGSAMAGAALFAKLPKVLIVSTVTGETVLRSAAISAGRMTRLASRIDVSPVQLEVGEIVIKLGGLPCVGGMTRGAIFTKASFMRFILLMARITRLRRPFEDTILMAGLASRRGMCSGQCERKAGVVHIDLVPACRGMARGAIGPQLTGMMIVFLMAGETILRRGFQPSQTARTKVTVCAACLSVQSGQLEGEQVMVEVRPECVESIMAVDTVSSKLKRVDLSLLRLH